MRTIKSILLLLFVALTTHYGVGQEYLSYLNFSVINETKREAKLISYNLGEEEFGDSWIGPQFPPTTSIVIPEKVTISGKEYTVVEIGDGALNYLGFKDNTGFHFYFENFAVSQIVLPSTIRRLGRQALNVHTGGAEFEFGMDGGGLSQLNLPDGLEQIGDNCFTYLGNITIPKNVSSLGNGNIQTRSNVITFLNSNFAIKSGMFASSWETIAGTAYQTTINQLKILGSNVTVSANALSWASVSSLVLGEYPVSINSGGFGNVSSITVNCSNPIAISETAFSTQTYQNVTLKVPAGSAQIYRNTAGWKKFAKIDDGTTQSFTSNNLTYTISSNNTVALTSCNKTVLSGHLNIPKSVSYQGRTYNVVSIDDEVFSGCNLITGVTIPSSMTSIGKNVFSGCTSMTSVVWNAKSCGNFQSGSYSPFYNICTQIKTFSFGFNVQVIPAYLCYGMTRLKSLSIPGSVKQIGNYAFYNCSGVELIFAEPSDPPTAQSYTFYNIPKTICKLYSDYVQRYKVATYWNAFTQTVDSSYENAISCESTISFDMGSIKSLSVGERTEWLPVTLTRSDNANELTMFQFTLVMPDGLSVDGVNYADDTKVYDESSEEDVQPLVWTFNWILENREFRAIATNYSRLPITKDKLQIAYIRIKKEAEPAIGSSIQVVDLKYTSQFLKYVWTPAGADPLKDGYSNTVRNPNGTTIIPGYGEVFSSGGLWYLKDSNGTSVSLTSNLYSGNISIPQSVTYGGKTYSVASIGKRAFYNCYNMKGISLPRSLTSIGESAFSYCKGLTSIAIPKSVTSIGSFALFECSNLQNIQVESGNTIYDSRNNCNAIIKTSSKNLVFGCNNTTIPGTVVSINNYAFQNMQSLANITIPKSVTYIGYASFRYCTGLTEIEIPNSATTVGGLSFFGCTGLKNVTIGRKASSIGGDAFGNCTSLETVKIKMKTPPTVSNTLFSNVPKSSCTLYVPIGRASYYRAANDWKGFSSIIEVEFPDDCDINGDDVIDVQDFNIVLNVLLGNTEKADADVNGDDEVDIFDINYVVNKILNIK